MKKISNTSSIILYIVGCIDANGGPGSSVGIMTELQAGWSGDHIPVGARFFAHIQTGPRSHPSSCTMGTRSFLGVKRPGCGADHPPLPSAKVENE
jgi:hypothetical protein